MGGHQPRLLLCAALALSGLDLGGCASMRADGGVLHLGNALNIYAPFDNSRDWGPSYLVEAPDHHLGYGARIDDSRTTPPDTNSRDTDSSGH
jgi:hypothetical protein